MVSSKPKKLESEQTVSCGAFPEKVVPPERYADVPGPTTIAPSVFCWKEPPAIDTEAYLAETPPPPATAALPTKFTFVTA